ncbi:hypothetical protein DOY81_005315 [Sarcophaga bullata]|nr:hypothetical protein DOY81_005315 [Sarcophaga bullata]
MYFTPTIFVAQLLVVVVQVLMTLNMMPLSTTMALPVTSKPIESTVENLAWQAWIELPPEEKQQVKSRKVTPKSIFTLPLRVECPEGHKQVDTKCIPLVIGSNAVLIDLNALGLVVGNTPSDELYDYDDIGEEEAEMANPRPHFGSDMQMGDAEKSMEGLTVELRPPSKDEPLKFNIFESKFNIFHEEPLEDYSALSNEGGGAGEKEDKNVTASDGSQHQQQQQQQTLNATDSAKIVSDLASESSNISENNFALAVPSEKNSSADAKEIRSTPTTLVDEEDFKIDAISLPIAGLETQNQPQKLAIFQKDTDGMQLVTTIMDSEAAATTIGDEKPQENDIQTLLQTESFLPLQHQANATATTILQSQEGVQANNSSSNASILTTISLPTPEQTENTPEVLSLNIEEEMTTLPSAMEPEPPQKSKQEFTRSVTMNPLMADDSVANDDDNDRLNDSTTLETEMIDEPNVETTTPIQLDETTVIETFSSLSSTPATLQQEQQQYDLQDLLMQQEQAFKDFEELQRMRSKGQTDQHHAVLKKSKVEPVEVLATTTTANNLPTTDAVEAAVETVTPLLTFDNENDNSNSNSNSDSNDRFYYQHFAKQDIKEAQQQPTTTTTTTTTKTSITTTTTLRSKLSEIEAMPLTSEIDRAEELRLINELVKGITPATKTLTTMPTAQTTTTMTTTTTEKPKTTSLSYASQSESSSLTPKTLPNSQQIWSKIMPLLTSTTTTTTTTPTTTATPKSTKTANSISEKSSIDSSTEYTENISNDIQATPTKGTSSESALLSSSSTRSNRNSKITRIHTADIIAFETTTEPHSSSESITATSSGSSTETATLNDTYEPYWWLPVAWRFDKPNDSASSERPNEQQELQPESEPEQEQDQMQEVNSEEPSLLLRFWSTYHASKSS